MYVLFYDKYCQLISYLKDLKMIKYFQVIYCEFVDLELFIEYLLYVRYSVS